MREPRVVKLWAVPLAIAFVGAFGCKAKAANDKPKIDVPPEAVQIAGALTAAPEDRREGATVLIYGTDGELKTGKQGTNDIVCLADAPTQKGFQSACYHKELDAYMARGRALRAEGVTDGAKNRETRWKEIDEGKLAMPKQPRTLYVMHGKGFDAEKGEVVEPYLRWVIFTPYATPESTGLSTQPGPSVPWLMFPGTPGAHIMINPPRP